MLGYRVEENFDLAKEKRRDRLKWVVGGGIGFLCLVYVFHPVSAAVFQGYFLTSICYGESFFVQRRDKIGKPWLWKAILATIPLHLLLLSGIVYLDRTFPNFFPKILVSLPILTVTFGIEAVIFDNIVNRFSPLDEPLLPPQTTF
jgi:hypothetical protein